MKTLFLTVILCLTVSAAQARSAVSLPATRSVTENCVAAAAREYSLPPAALFGLLAVEGGKDGVALQNANGTWDLGSYQVNTCNLNALAKQGFAPEAILRDGCVNARAAAWILRREYERAGDIWTAIGAYHSRTPSRHAAYVAKVRNHLARMGKTLGDMP